MQRSLDGQSDSDERDGDIKQLQEGVSNGVKSSHRTKKKKHKNGHNAQPPSAEFATIDPAVSTTAATPSKQGGGAAGHEKKPSYADVAKGTAHPSEEAHVKEAASRELQMAKNDLNQSLRKQRYSRPSPLHVIFGHASSSKRLNWLSLLTNLVIVAMCADFQFTPLYGKEVANTTFVRIGAVTSTSAKVVARVPPSLYSSPATNSPRPNRTLFHHHHESALPTTPSDAARLVYRPVKPLGSAWQYGGVISADSETDYVAALRLTSLLPSTQYEYALVLPDDQSHRFQPPSIEHPQYFTTAPDPKLSLHQTYFKFVASSCVKPGFPYVPGQDHLSIQGAADLADRIHSDRIDFMVGCNV